MDKEAQIAELKKILFRHHPQVPAMAEALYAAGYRKLPVRPKVLSDEKVTELLSALGPDATYGKGLHTIAQAAVDAAIKHYEG